MNCMKLFYEKFKNSVNTCYVSEYLRKLFNDNDIEKESIAKLTDDELTYIYKTCNGIFWDEFQGLFPGLERKQIKEKLFAQVFYSKEKSRWWKMYANEFQKLYPNVYDYINLWKEPEKDKKLIEYMKRNQIDVENTSTALSISMMKLESAIFTESLNRIYKKRISAVHIHDAIIIPDVKGTAKVEANTIVNILMDVYKEHGICPSMDIKSFSRLYN